ncbi:hypothetical protein DCC26_00335 [Auritidibacter sp. NML120779]|nr:hypothetical protein DCC26_00335 [Auritidibacter sp. NML120779]
MNTMSKTEYEPDRFSHVPEYTTEHGAHRADFRGPESSAHLIWIILAAGLALAIGAFSFILLPQLRSQIFADAPVVAGPSPEEDPDAVLESPTDASDASNDVGSPDPADSSVPDDAETAVDEDATGAEPSATEETQESAEVDYQAPVSVYNSTTINGLAAQTEAELTQAGFNVVTVGDWNGGPVTSNIVYFDDPALQATAEEVASQVGGQAQQNDTVSGLTVVVVQ